LIVTNLSTGIIRGGNNAPSDNGGTALGGIAAEGILTLDNSGLIEGGSNSSSDFGGLGVGVATQVGSSSIINQASGTISGGLNTTPIELIGVFKVNGFGIYNFGAISSLTNLGQINGSIAVVNLATIEQFSNSGTITSDADWAQLGAPYGTVTNFLGTITSFTNSGTISALPGNYAIANFGGTITNGIDNTGLIDGMIELGGATLNLNGTSGRVTGAVTDIDLFGEDSNTGTVNVNGTFTTENTFQVGTMNVASGGILNLNHDVSVVTGGLNNSGTLQVGTGLRTVIGSFTQTSGATFGTTVLSDTQYGQLKVNGTATLAGKAEVTVSKAATALTNGGTLAGVITADAITGTFTEINSSSSIYTFSGIYGSTSFDLLVAAQTSSIADNVSIYGTPAAAGAARVLDQLAAAPGAMAPVLDTLDGMSGQTQANAVAQSLPVLVGASSMAASQSQVAFNNVLKSRQEALLGMSSGEEFAGNRQAWGKAFGSWANQGDLNKVSGYSVDSGGLAVGIDKQISPKSNLGLAFAYAYSNVSSKSSVAPSSVNVNSFQLGLYGDYQLDSNMQLNYQVDGAVNTNSSSRNLNSFAGTTGVGANANGSYNSYVGHVGVGLKKFFNINSNTRLTPEVRLDYMAVNTDGYTETGGGLLNLNVNSQTYSTLYPSLSLRADHLLSNGLNLTGNIGVAYNVLDNNVQMTSAYQGGGAAFVTNGLNISPWLYHAGVGIGGKVGKNVELNVRYDIDFSSSSYTNQMVSARVKFLF